MAMAARMPMIATTIINSMRVKPFCTDFIAENSYKVLSTKSAAQKRRGESKQSVCQDLGVFNCLILRRSTYAPAPAFNILLSHTDATRWLLCQKMTQNVT